MKKIGVILLAIGLTAVFSAAVFAMDVKFSGEFYAAGLYLDRTTVKKDTATDRPSTAFYYQRLRVKTEFVISSGLILTTRFDAMERAWGATRSTPGTALDSASAGTRAENENIAFDWAYITYQSPIGVFDVGYMNDGTIGTVFGDSSAPGARIKYAYTAGPVTFNAKYTKLKEGSRTVVNPTGVADADVNKYGTDVVYKSKDFMGGLSFYHYRYADTRPTANNTKLYYLLTPFATAKIGPVALQAEFNYAWGKENEYDSDTFLADVDMQNISGWIDAVADFGMFYAGGTVAYVSGDDPGTAKKEGGTLTGGIDWNPCLIMWNYERTYWAGDIDGYNSARQSSPMSNAWFFQVRGGVRPIDKLDIMAAISYASADRKPANYLHNEYGYEVDLTATYKITNNLSYMLGVGYLFTGDYYKGTSDANNLNNDYLVVNKLTLTF
jgi:hypothetical protein